MPLNLKVSPTLTIPFEPRRGETIKEAMERFITMNNLPGRPDTAMLVYNGMVVEGTLADLPDGVTLLYLNASSTFSEELQEQISRGQSMAQRGEMIPPIIKQDLEEVSSYYPELLVNYHPSIYTRVKIHEKEVVCVIDSGCEISTMSLRTAQDCGLEEHIDRRYQGLARGVGKANIVGMIHLALVSIGTEHFVTNFVVLETDVDTLIGMSFIRMYRAIIDMKTLQFIVGESALPIMPLTEVEDYLAQKHSK
ncbi:DDI1-like DNA-damage inducible protein [Giardia muris]|uniref:DDI1-like DNA-damage inducible protein n=1 Tax=Giardia muris TaxID=5742 RepID=A0A4Z1SY90_GIAMU|nr:DDI1-like DNA-damage inducible protein [Giardia muris]|eukprot:TNJ30712.1 DDI1-like DNA-damage inducible protein [Giardia muris]